MDYSLGKLVFIPNPEKFSDLNLPLIGFGGEDLIKEKGIKEIIEKLMTEEKITYRDFIIKQIPALTLEGGLRAAFTKVKDLTVGKLEEDELNPKKNKIKLTFSLGKGSYATMVIKSMFN
ncbi:tRNA pseudouridine(13) synthase TruD [Candidatus Woesearchaeota archaeon]|nr:tRNA pseudouridine(13) synthase TruD [Candidatus Woesearchaeota archaeon]